MKILTVVDCFMRVVLYVLINASLKDYTSQFDSVVIGKFTDFSVEWYQKVGYILVFLMATSISSPMIETGCEWFVKWVMRLIDTRGTLNPYNSRKDQKQQFIELYSGTEF
jgi:hypothetical protein